jgi:kynurenine formamidase
MCPPQLFELLRQPHFSPDSSGSAGSSASPPSRTTPRTLSYTHLTDLTQTLTPATPVFPGFPPVQIEPFFSHDQHGVAIEKLSRVNHSGTHLDAPYHCSPTGLFVDQMPAETLIVPAVVIDIAAQAQHDHAALVKPDDLLAWERANGRIPNGAAVIMRSGWGARYGDAATFVNADASGVAQFPGFGLEAAQWLLAERNVAGLGVDTLSLDHGPSPNFAVHMAFLPTQRWGLECLANLDQLPASGATLFIGAPKIGRGSGAPARVLAMW